ncbi:MAG: ribonuclease P protein component [Prevotella sp.]|nr:ribonuclease P protein component [Prevotella sp.]
MINTLTKGERLCSTKSIDRLFSSGKSFIAYPLRIVYIKEDSIADKPRISILVSVSKKKFKRAVKRNRIKRLIREAYRLNKSELSSLLGNKGKRLNIAFLYLKNELSDYAEIENAISKTMAILVRKVREDKDI